MLDQDRNFLWQMKWSHFGMLPEVLIEICLFFFQILPVDCLTRITQYVPEVVTFIQRVMENGYA